MSRETKFKLKDKMDNHLMENDTFLLAALDIAAMGRQEMEDGENDGGDRFCAIQELLTMYRKRNQTFVQSLYKPLDPKMAA